MLANAKEFMAMGAAVDPELKLNWKGRKNAEKLDQNSLDFGMNIKNVSKTLGFKPYYIKRNVSNEAVYCYRYYYFDEMIGCDRAFNYYVEYTYVKYLYE